MSLKDSKRIGLIVGRDHEWSDAFIDAVSEIDENVTAELVKIGGSRMGDVCRYDVIFDRVSNEVPYYRAYLQFAALQGVYIINNPFTWSADNKFFGIALSQKLGFTSPRTVILPNKHIEKEMTPDSFRNLTYPMDWQGIIDYVGVPAIFKNIESGGRTAVHRVHDIDELIQLYDESGTLTMILQQIIDSDEHFHCFVFGHETVMPLRYSLQKGRYLPGVVPTDTELGQQLVHQALTVTQAYGYDVNVVEFVRQDEQLYVVNSTNPAPVMNCELMTQEQFDRSVYEIANIAVDFAKRPLPQRPIFDHIHNTQP